MNITYLRLKPVLRELQGIRKELTRMNDIKELELAYQGLHIKPPVADVSGPEPETMYTDEQKDALRELNEIYGLVGKNKEE